MQSLPRSSSTRGAEELRFRTMQSVLGSIHQAFSEQRRSLAEVELCEGLVEIGDDSFGNCDHSITRIIIPTSLKRIGGCAFWNSLRTATTRLRMVLRALEIAHSVTASSQIFTNLRVPPLIIPIPESILYRC